MFWASLGNGQTKRDLQSAKQSIVDLNSKLSALENKLKALDRSMAIIEFDPSGTILNANDNFLSTLGYRLDEIIGKHHRIFLRASEQSTPEYSNFWRRLQSGEFFSGEFPRVNKSGQEVWIQATYNPVFDELGRVVKVVKLASDITMAKKTQVALNSQAEAVSRCFAVIEFKLDGTIVQANKNFLDALGYDLSEITGRHHRIFVTDDFARSPEYAVFWKNLNQGRYQSGEFHRVGKGGRSVHIQASYNPIFGINGEITAVIKYASDITQAVIARDRTSVVSNSVSASVMQMTQTINEINSNVLSTATLAKDAETLARTTTDSVRKLDEGSRTIEKVIEVIRDLADQTNLLALNATIESARAGEAGRGFAVVASEVKDLAKHTAQATQNIEATVNMIQNSINEVVDYVNQISSGVSNVSNNMTVISAAVEEQSVTMSSIADTALELQQC